MRSLSTRLQHDLPHPAALAVIAAGMLALTLAVTFASAAEGVSQVATEPAPQRRGELVRLVRHDCGSCHGLTLRGGLGPPLTPQALAGKSAAYLKAMILDSRPGTAMPHWRALLSEAEAAWIAAKLLQGMPDVD